MNPYPVLPIGADYRTSRGLSGFTRVVGKGGETIWCNAPIFRKKDFLGAAALLTDEWAAQEGTDSTQATQAISAGIVNGEFRVASGNDDGTYAADGSQITTGLNLKASLGGILVEARVRGISAVTTVSFGFGLTDTVALEEPFSVATATQTSNCSDGAMFTYDTAMTTPRYWASAVNTDVDTSAASTGVLPVADTYNILRIEANANGDTQWFIDDVLVKDTVSAAFNPAILLTPILYVCSTTTTARIFAADYITYAACRF